MLKKPSVSILLGLCAFIITYNILPSSTGKASEELQSTPTQAATTLLKPAATLSKTDVLSAGSICVDFKDADIQTVLRILALKGNVNIVAGSDVAGNITVKLTDVSWKKALDVIST